LIIRTTRNQRKTFEGRFPLKCLVLSTYGLNVIYNNVLALVESW